MKTDCWETIKRNGCKIIHCITEQEWLNERKKYITASESACVLGIGFNDNIWLWEEKTNRAHKVDDFNDATLARMKKGQVNESLSRMQWANETGHTVIDGTRSLIVNQNIMDANGNPFMAATLDGIGIDNSGELYIIELKFSESTSMFKNGLPPKYRCQVLKQMIVTGIRKAVLLARIVWFDMEGVRCVRELEFKFNADDSDIENDMKNMIEAERIFWNKYVLTGKRPPKLLPEI